MSPKMLSPKTIIEGTPADKHDTILPTYLSESESSRITVKAHPPTSYQDSRLVTVSEDENPTH